MEESEIFEVKVAIEDKFTLRWEKGIGLDVKVRKDKRLGHYKKVGDTKEHLIKAPCAGKIIFLEVGDHELSSQKVCVIEKCKHDVVTMGLCTFCGMKAHDTSNQFVGFVDRSFAISDQRASEIYQDLEAQVLQQKQLFLILDLDNTIIHAHLFQKGNNSLSLEEIKTHDDIYVLDLPPERYLLKLRPGLKEFLTGVSSQYFVYVYTKGTRQYAETILKLIDPDEKIISQKRLITRDEMEGNDFKSIRKIIYDGSMALILDDSTSVWAGIKNLIFTKPFVYFFEEDSKILIKRKVDAYLFFIQHLLITIHEIFYSLYSRNMKPLAHEIYHTIRQNLFTHEKISFYTIFQNEAELKKSREYYTLTKLGGSVFLEPTNESTLIFSRYSKKLKACPIQNVPIVSLWYISYCEMFCTRLDPTQFDLKSNDGILIPLEKKMKEISLKGQQNTNGNDQNGNSTEKSSNKEESEKDQNELNSIKDDIEVILMRDYLKDNPLKARIQANVIEMLELKFKNKRKPEGLPLETQE